MMSLFGHFRKRAVLFVMTAGLILSATNQAYAVMLTVDAYQHSSNSGAGAGLDTGLYFAEGDFFSVTVSSTDLWSAGYLPRWSNADGLIVDLYATGSDESGESAGTRIGQNWGATTQHGFTAPYGALVGEISGDFFLIGTSFSGAAPDSGNLKLYYWDTYTPDNTEKISANITAQISPVPEPSTIFLLGSGLLGLVGLNRRRKA